MTKKSLVIIFAICFAVMAFAIKFIYLQTAESRFNSEELPLAAMTIVSGTPAFSNVSSTRLYGTAQITTAMSLSAFGFNVFAIKLPNFIFFSLTIAFLYLFMRREYPEHGRLFAAVPSFLIAFGPPIAQMWGLKNRGGFIETICALSLCLWICSTLTVGPRSDVKKLVIGLIMGLAIWSQPIAIIWVLPILWYVVQEDLRNSPKSALPGFGWISLGVVCGLMPLLNLNVLYNFNTIRVIDTGEFPSGVDLGYVGRSMALLTGGIPRILGLKEHWVNDWILPKPLALFVYAVLLLPAAIASVQTVVQSIRQRRVSLAGILVAVAAGVIAANIATSWGNFQAEPRRLLLLYIPYAVLTALGLRQLKLTSAFLLVWVVFCSFANYRYIDQHRNGFKSAVYEPLDEVAGFLINHGIKGVYTDVWTGGRVTFASKGTIPWYRFKYLPTSYGFVGDDFLRADEALLFNHLVPETARRQQRFMTDLSAAGISCDEKSVQQIVIVFSCSDVLNLNDIRPIENASFSDKGPQSADIKLAFDDPRVYTQVGTRKEGAITATGAAGYLIYGPYQRVPPGNYKVTLDISSATPYTFEVASHKGSAIHFRREVPASPEPNARKQESFDFAMDKYASDLEIRLLVPEGSDAKVHGYELRSR